MQDTLLPDLEDYDFVNDPATKLSYEKHCQECRDLADFYRKRAVLHGKIQSSLTSEVHKRVLDKYGPEFFGGENPTSVLFDSVLELPVPVGMDRNVMVTTLKRARLNFNMHHTEKPRI